MKFPQDFSQEILQLIMEKNVKCVFIFTSTVHKSTEKTHARRDLYALWITILCVLDNKDVYRWQE